MRSHTIAVNSAGRPDLAKVWEESATTYMTHESSGVAGVLTSVLRLDLERSSPAAVGERRSPGGATRLCGGDDTSLRDSTQWQATMPGMTRFQGGGASSHSSIGVRGALLRLKLPSGSIWVKSDASERPSCCRLAGPVSRTCPGLAPLMTSETTAAAAVYESILPPTTAAGSSPHEISLAATQCTQILARGPRCSRTPCSDSTVSQPGNSMTALSHSSLVRRSAS
mmetsp:Transcript_26008/g.72863  ORF Transcript_26008/g.72863 Transcript_26008/m.72863 type:complete len:225 (+) Transcript_26008:499-1173(+)